MRNELVEKNLIADGPISSAENVATPASSSADNEGVLGLKKVNR